MYLVDFDFLVFVDYYVHNHFVFVAKVGSLSDIHFHVVESFLLEICGNDFLGTVDDVLGNLVANHQVQTFFDVFALAFFHSVVIDL